MPLESAVGFLMRLFKSNDTFFNASSAATNVFLGDRIPSIKN